MHTGVWWGNLMERDPLEDQSLDGRIILRWILKKWDVGHRLDLSGSEYGQVAGPCRGSN